MNPSCGIMDGERMTGNRRCMAGVGNARVRFGLDDRVIEIRDR
jgi:hypothetical protein